MAKRIQLKTHRVRIKAPRELIFQKMSSFGRGHLKWPINGGAEMVAWGAAERAADATSGARYRVRLGFNEYRGNRKVQLTVDEIRPPSE
ncbi:MAG: hypothetical protein IIA41_15615 [SAR324 cluster bacterium]|nr:hypothetical protein [SAR324 cluster bacterium]